MLIVGTASTRKALVICQGAILTPEAAPASDVAGIVLRQQRALLWQACRLDGVTHQHGLCQLDEGNVIAGTRAEVVSMVEGPGSTNQS